MSVKIFRGDTWTRIWTIKDSAGNIVDLTGATARLHVRDSNDTLIFAATMDNGSITIDGSNGTIIMNVSAAVTRTVAPGTYYFDLEVTYPSGVVRTYEQDKLIVLKDITHD